MIERSSLKVNFSWSLIGNLIFSFSQWAILIILTKLVSVEEVGMFSYGVAFTAPFVLFLQFQLRSVQITDVNNNYSFSHYFNLRLLTTAFSFILIASAALFFTRLDTGLYTIILCVALMKLADSVSDIIYGLFQKYERMQYVATSRIVKATFTILVYAIILIVFNNVQIAILSIVVVKVLIIIFFELRYAKKFEAVHLTFDFSAFKKLLIYALPLGIMSTLMSIESNIPRYVLQEYEGAESLGYFSALAYINMLGSQMITAVSQAAAPRLAIYYESNKNNFRNLLLKLTLLGTFIGIISVLFMLAFGKTFISILYNPDYAKQIDVFILIIIAGAINYSSSFLGTALTSAKAFKVQPYLGLLWIVSSFALSIILIPKYGLIGAGIALIVTSIVKLLSKLVVICIILKSDRHLIKK